MAFAIASFPLEIGAPDRLEPLVGLGVDARDEEARDGQHLGRVAAGSDEPFETAEVGLGDGRVALEREDQGDVDRDALGDAILDRAETGLGGRDLDVEVRAVDLLVEPDRLLERALALVGERRVDLERDPAVDSGRSLPDRRIRSQAARMSSIASAKKISTASSVVAATSRSWSS